MTNPIVNLYRVTYSFLEEEGESLTIREREVYLSACGGWDAVNDVVAFFVAQLDGITNRPRVEQIARVGATLIVTPDLLKDIRDAAGGDPAKAGEFIQPLADLHLA